MSSQAWQQPFVNIFKHYGAGEWKKCTKVGDVTKLMERTVKSSVYRICGPIPSGNYIQLPKSKSLGLTGHYLYILFKPITDKYYSIHIDVATSDGVVVRISLSNLFKEFKSSSTWLQFPVVSNPPPGSVEEATNMELKLTGQAGMLPSSARWTLLCLDVQYALSVFLNKHFAYFKSLRLCSNMFVKNAFTSSTCYEPGLDIKFARKAGLLASGVVPLPSEMSFPLEKHEDWHEKYDYIKFPSDKKTSFRDVSKNKSSVEIKGNKNDTLGSLCARQKPMTISELESKSKDNEDSLFEKSKQTKEDPDCSLYVKRKVNKSPSSKVVKTRIALAEKVTSTLANSENQRPLPQVLPTATVFSSVDYKEDNGGIHVYASPRRREKENKVIKNGPKSPTNELAESMAYNAGKYVAEKNKIHGYSSTKERKTKDKKVELRSFNCGKGEERTQHSQLLPDPILSLKKVVGFGGGSYTHALWSSDGDIIIYPCYGIIVNLNVTSGKQDFLLGHNSKVSALALTEDNTILASAQSGKGSIIRLWNFKSRKCITVFKSTINDICRLSFSKDGRKLCGVGEDSHFKQVIVVWNVGIVGRGGKVSVIAKAHTESSFSLINNIKFVPSDDERLVSCGNHNIRVWRIKSNVLRSCPVDLAQHAEVEFTDFVFDDPTTMSEKDSSKLTMYFTASNGWMYKVDYRSLKIINIKKLLPNVDENQNALKDGSMSLNCIAISEHFCAVGSEDGFLRLWPLNFKSVFLEAEHDSPVSVVSISDDRSKVFAGTTSGNLGFLDITSRIYTTITRSHAGDVTSFSFNKCVQQIATISTDNSIKLWDEETLRQVYDFQATNEKPTTICCHPMKAEFACGFKSGAIRLFSLNSSSLLYELKEHLGSVHSVLFHPTGQFLYSAGSDGTLILYEGSYITSPYTVTRTLPESVTKETLTAHNIALDVQGRFLAVIGSSPYLISLYGAKSLDELLHINITCMVDPKSNLVVDEVIAVTFSPRGTLLAATSTSRILKLDCSTGQILSETSNIHRGQIKSLSCSADGKYLATAGDQCIKVWDYLFEKDLNFQVFIGHCSPISRLEFSPDGHRIISVGESLFVWDFLAEKSFAELYLDEQPNAQDGFKDQLVKSPHLPPQPVHQLGILELSSSTKMDDVVLSSKDDQKTADGTLDDSAIDFMIESEENLPAAINISDSDHDEPEVIVPDISKASKVIISNHAPPKIIAHYKTYEKNSKLAEKRYAPPDDQAGMILDAAVGCDGNGRHNMHWHPETGIFMYSSGGLLIVEDLENGKQHILHGHAEDISTLGMKNDGQVVATGGCVDVSRNVSQICIWDLTTMTCDMILEKHHSSIVSLQYSRDDRFMVSVTDYRDCSFIIWCAKDYFILNERKTIYPVHTVRWNPFLVNELCSVGRNEAVLFWNLIERKPNYVMEVTNGDIPKEVFDPNAINKDMTSLCYVDEQILITATSCGVVCVWNLNTKQCIMHWKADDSEIDVLAAISGRLVTGSISKKLRVWSTPVFDKMTKDGNISDLGSCSIVMEDEKQLDGGIISASFDDTLEMGVIGTLMGTVWYINFEEESGIHVVSGHHLKINQIVICCGDNKYFATCSTDGSLRLWNAVTREQTAQFLVIGQECNCATFCSKPRDSLSTDISEYNQVIHPVTSQHKEHPSQCVAGYSDGTVRIFDFGRMEKLLKMKPHSSPVVKILCPIDGRVILSGSADGILTINSMTTGLTMRVLNDHMGCPISQISQQQGRNDVSLFLWLACSKDCRISVWSADWVKDVCELSDWITFPGNEVLNDRKLSKNKQVSVTDVPNPPTLAKFSYVDLDLLIYTGFSLHKEICFYSLAKKKVLRTISLTEWAFGMDISPSGNLIALGFQDRLVKLVDSSVGTFQDFVGHSDTVINIQFSNDGSRLITSSRSQLLLWNIML